MLDDWYRRYDRFMKWFDPYLPMTMMVSLGVAMIFYGGYAFITYSNDLDDSLRVLMAMASGVVVVSGFIIIFDPNRNYIRSAVIFSFAIGLFRLLSYYQNFLDRIAGDITALKTVDYVFAAMYLILAALGLLMFVTAIAIQMGFTFRRNSLMWTCIIQMFTSIFYILYESAMVYDFSEIIQDRIFQLRVCEFVLFMIVLYIFDSDEVRNGSTWGKHNIMMSSIRNGKVFDNNAFIAPGTAAAILDRDDPAWRDLMDCGPVEKEIHFVINGRGYNSTEAIAQIWKGDPRLHITCQGYLDTTVLFPSHMTVDSVYMKGDRLFFEGKDGTMMSFSVRNADGDDRFEFLGARV